MAWTDTRKLAALVLSHKCPILRSRNVQHTGNDHVLDSCLRNEQQRSVHFRQRDSLQDICSPSWAPS